MNPVFRKGLQRFQGVSGLGFMLRVALPVRRQGFWNQWQLNLRESSAHLVGLIMRHVVCDASAVLRVSFV